MNRRLAQMFDEYASYHTTAGNKLCHYFGVPAIVVASLGLLSHVGLWIGDTWLDLSMAMVVGAGLYYIPLEWRIGLPFTFFAITLRGLALRLPLELHVALFVLGWVAQFVGHYVYEKKAPAFFGHIQHLFIGPLWVFARACGGFGI